MGAEEWHVRDDALRLYRETELTPDQIAEHLGIDPASVLEWIKKNGRLRTIHMPQNKNKLKARRMEVLRLSANGHDVDYIAKTLGLSDRSNVSRLLRKALEEMAGELRDEKAWERAKALHLARVEALVVAWTPKAVKDPESKAGDRVLKALALIAQVSGFNTINVKSGDTPPTDLEVDVASVLTGLQTLASRLIPPTVIDGEVLGTDSEPVSELPSQNGLTPEHD